MYIGGFANGQNSAEKVSKALENYFEVVEDPFTFSAAFIRDKERLAKVVRGAEVITHSAGYIALAGLEHDQTHIFNGPLPRKRRQLLGRTATKTIRMHAPGLGLQSPTDIISVAAYDASSVGELAMHPVANLGAFIKNKISKFNSIYEADNAFFVSNIPATLITTEHDSYFKLNSADRYDIRQAKLPLIELPGEHDELVLRPEQTLENYFSKIN